jgi:penicillin amidase
VAGLTAPVRILRDRWGVPHVAAASQDDLFFAQGFVQAQDRLFQMDLWRRSVQGRLSQVLGANFIERDAMTRRVQYRGDLDREWASYGPDARAIASAFVRGINAWVTLARERPPEEFVLAGWKPEYWSPHDLLNRTDAFLASGDAIAEVRQGHLSEVIAEAIGRVGAPPFFAGLAGDVRLPDVAQGSSPAQQVRLKADPTYFTAISPSRVAAHDGSLSLFEAHRNLSAPSPRYIVHLKAPGWNVIGATAPWLPGVALGHNERVAWGMSPIEADTQDISVEEGWTGSTGGTGRRGEIAKNEMTVVTDAIVVKGRKNPFVFETEITPRGFVVAVDRERGRAFTLRWSGTETGAAPELGALALDRAASWPEFREALGRWRMPARRVVYADRDGNVGFQDVALVPRRRGAEWTGWVALDDLPHALNKAVPPVARTPEEPGRPPAMFAHVLGITDAARRRFNIGPYDRPRDDHHLQLSFDPRNWDRSRAIVAPGQSESPASPHFADLGARWAAGDAFPLVFSDEAVAANAEATLTIVPKRTAPARQ